MIKNSFTEELKDIIESVQLKNTLQKIALNYPNLKQELHIRNAILEIFNSRQNSVKPEAIALAEQRIEGRRVDLCFVRKENPQFPYKIELKFQFSKDFNRFEAYYSTIEKDFETRESDSFLLIVATWNIEEKIEFDRTWNITPNLNQYICEMSPKNELWKTNLINHFKTFDATNLKVVNHSTSKPYPVEYYFYLLTRKV